MYRNDAGRVEVAAGLVAALVQHEHRNRLFAREYKSVFRQAVFFASMTVQHRTFLVYGRVKGVFYRQSTVHQARQLGLSGYARNNPDGTVTIEAEGSVEALEALEAWCRQGPPAAHVTQVDVTIGPVQHHSGFEVRR